jgi:hypothetical protein
MSAANISKYNFITERDYIAVAGPDWPSFSQFQTHCDIPKFVYDEIDEMMTGPKNFNNNAFCVLPFYSIELPRHTPCCLLPDNVDIELIKHQMLNNQRPVECSKCWKLEDSGIKSDRIIKNETLDYYFDQDLISIFNECADQKNSIRHYKIDSSNVCNATCITCDSKSSSAWAQLQRKNQLPAWKHWQITPVQIHNQINYQTAKSITFRGGEPFLSNTNFYVLEQLLEHDNSDCFISFVTNGSIALNDYQKHLISQFKNKNFCFSIDGIGSVFEYLRYPLSWNAIEKNIQYCRDNNILISASYTISNLNVLYHNQTLNWFKENQIRFINNPVYTPVYFQPSALPVELKKNIANSMIDTELASALLQEHNDQDEQNYQQFRIMIAHQDQLKGIQMKHYLPKLAELLDL